MLVEPKKVRNYHVSSLESRPWRLQVLWRYQEEKRVCSLQQPCVPPFPGQGRINDLNIPKITQIMNM